MRFARSFWRSLSRLASIRAAIPGLLRRRMTFNPCATNARYGWPLATYGTDYDGSEMGQTQAEGTEQPVYYWDPSPANRGMAFYDGDMFPATINKQREIGAKYDFGNVAVTAAMDTSACAA